MSKSTGKRLMRAMQDAVGVEHEPIHTFDTPGMGVILLCPSDVMWTNQVGGIACRHPCAEGVFVPVGALPGMMWGSRSRGGIPADPDGGLIPNAGAMSDGIEPEEADDVDGFFAQHKLPFVVDRARLRDSAEAWVYIMTKADVDQHGFGSELAAGQAGIFVWTNSD